MTLRVLKTSDATVGNGQPPSDVSSKQPPGVTVGVKVNVGSGAKPKQPSAELAARPVGVLKKTLQH